MAYYYPEDLIKTESSWYYQWGVCPVNAYSGCVPMSRDGSDPNLPPDYDGYILLFNEPNNPEPYGHPISPQEGAKLYLDLHTKYPKAKWVVGNVSAWAISWLIEFRNNINIIPEAWGIHGYVEAWITPSDLISWWDESHNILGGNFWITEWADTLGDIANDKILQTWMDNTEWVKRYAYFTNRAHGDEPWYPQGWNVQLFDWNTGEPTNIGKWYMNEYYQTYIPIVQNG